jgi:molecular chaperone Hsp33
MGGDAFHPFFDEGRRLAAAVVVTTETCREATRLHGFAPTSCIAMGRVLTAAPLAALVHKRTAISLQVLADRHLRQMFADATPEGHLRGYSSNPTLVVSRPGGDGREGRRSIASAVGRGTLSVIRYGEGHEFTQSTTELVSGELDLDVEHFLSTSDQIPTALACDVILDDDEQITHAGGMIVQAMPDAPANAVEAVRGRVHEEFPRLLTRHAANPVTLMRSILPDAAVVQAPVPLRWQCRCSRQRAFAGLKMLPPGELAQMVDTKEVAEVTCDFCHTTYSIPSDEVEQAFLETITARG